MELNSLPEKWSIKAANLEEEKIINKYARDSGGDHWTDSNNYAKKLYLNISKLRYARGTSAPNYTIITFKQFKKWVLKEDIKLNYEIY